METRTKMSRSTPRVILFLLWFFLIGFNHLNQIHGQETAEKAPEKAPEASADPDFLNADKNSDGSLDFNELQGMWVKNFAEYIRGLDADGDSRISPEEYKRHREMLESVWKKKEAAPPQAVVAEFTETYNQRFLGKNPKIGTTIDGLMAFDEDGNEFDFDDLRGKYTVINFGCLT